MDSYSEVRSLLLACIEETVDETLELRERVVKAECEVDRMRKRLEEIMRLTADGLRPIKCCDCDDIYWLHYATKLPDRPLCEDCERQYVDAY